MKGTHSDSIQERKENRSADFDLTPLSVGVQEENRRAQQTSPSVTHSQRGSEKVSKADPSRLSSTETACSFGLNSFGHHHDSSSCFQTISVTSVCVCRTPV